MEAFFAVLFLIFLGLKWIISIILSFKTKGLLRFFFITLLISEVIFTIGNYYIRFTG